VLRTTKSSCVEAVFVFQTVIEKFGLKMEDEEHSIDVRCLNLLYSILSSSIGKQRRLGQQGHAIVATGLSLIFQTGRSSQFLKYWPPFTMLSPRECAPWLLGAENKLTDVFSDIVVKNVRSA
jgi:hypothetical protein